MNLLPAFLWSFFFFFFFLSHNMSSLYCLVRITSAQPTTLYYFLFFKYLCTGGQYGEEWKQEHRQASLSPQFLEWGSFFV